MQVWNEEICLPCSLKGLLPNVDELVIVNGGPHGPSTDSTKAIIDNAIAAYPEKIKYLEGTYLREDGAWDETRQVNDGIAQITGDYMMRTSADIIFDDADVGMIRQIIERFPDRRLFYSPMIDFGGDTEHIILQGHMTEEEILPREIVQADGLVWSMAAKPHAVEVGERRLYGMVADIDYSKDILYMPHVKRFHYGYVKPFEWLVTKYVRLISAKHHENWEELQRQGEKAMLAEAIHWVSNLKNTLPAQPYTGCYPVNGEPLRSMDVMDGYEEFMAQYNAKYLLDHSRPNTTGWIDRVPTDEEIANFNEARMPVEQGALTLEGIGMNKIESFLADVIAHYYPDCVANVLDVGCGNAKFLTALLQNGVIKEATGIDASVTMVENARKTVANVAVEASFLLGSFETLEPGPKFDVLIAKDILEHLYDVNSGVARMHAALKDGGMLCGSVPFWDTCDCDAHLHHFTTISLRPVLERFFTDVGIRVVDLTGKDEHHIIFTCRLSRGQ
jgi:2-polyprenyl-3-methyl-5-hydroxy-6-metoxy-1,4-benzoquinol methylase